MDEGVIVKPRPLHGGGCFIPTTPHRINSGLLMAFYGQIIYILQFPSYGIVRCGFTFVMDDFTWTPQIQGLHGFAKFTL